MALEGKGKARILVLVTLCVILFMSADYLLGGTLRTGVRGFMEPLIRVTHRAMSGVLQSDFWKTRGSLQSEIVRLTAEVEREKGMRAALEVIRGENEILRSLARLAEKTHGVTVPITSSFSSSPYGTFTIGGGSSSGIQIGDLALAGDGFVLGSVTDVSQNSAVVRAVFSPGVSTEVATTDAAFTLRGRGGGNARAEVPRELPLFVGGPVIAPAFASRPVGIIGKIESASSSAFSDVFVLFPYNANTIRYVFVTPP